MSDREKDRASQLGAKDLYQVQETLKKLCEFSTVWADVADRADLGSQKFFSKLATFFAHKTRDHFKINFQKITNQKKLVFLAFKPKQECWFQSMIEKLIDLNHKTNSINQSENCL